MSPKKYKDFNAIYVLEDEDWSNSLCYSEKCDDRNFFWLDSNSLII